MPRTFEESAVLVEDRLEEPEGAPVFWNQQLEIYTAISEAISEATLLVGRPTQIINVYQNLLPNTPWQPMPAGVLAITDIQGPREQIWKWTLRDMDYTQVGNQGSDWENDVTPGQTIYRWWPMGLTQYGVWPSVPHVQTVTITGIASPVIQGWPYSGSQAINLHDEFLQAIEKYAAHYLRIKETGTEFETSLMLYQGFMDDMRRMTAIENRRDPYIFTRGIGAAADRGQVPDQR